MKPERWQKIEKLYHSALEREADQRTAFLAEACAGNDSLRREVESLLAHQPQAENLLETPVMEVAAKVCADDQGDSLVGRSLGSYKILSRLGAGGMGEVYQARDSRLDRTVAIKLLPIEFAADQDRMRRFVREAKAASALNHPHVATIYEIGEVDGVNFIAMEYVEGQTLAARINGHTLRVSEIIEIGSQIADALDEAHGKGITHRDIKPANVMITPRGQVKVLDFGLAKIARPAAQPIVTDTSTMTKTEPGLVVGTVPYMSPEQALGREVDHRSDVFSLGVTLYEMATGRLPFSGMNTSETLDRILHAQPEAMARFNYDAPAELERIVRKCLEKERERRYQSARDLLIDLKTLQRDSQAGAVAAAPITVQRQDRSRRLFLSVLAIMLLTLAALAAYLFMQRAQPKGQAINSIAVLPFKPLVAESRDDALEMGTASILITRLGSLRQLIVRPESAVEGYARPDQDPLAAGREQKVDAVLDSRYQRSGDKFRFTLRLLRVADGATLWADTLDQPAADLFTLEDALSAKVTNALRLTLSSADKELLAKRYTNSPEAWQLYVRGRHLAHQRRIPDIEKAITYFQQAIILDHSFALPHAMLGFSYDSLSRLGHSPAKELMPKAKVAYDQALKLDDQLAEAHSYLARYKHDYEWDYDGAEQEHKLALDLNPNSADVRHGYAYYLTFMGRFEQAISENRKAEELDPTDMFISRDVALVFYFARRYDEAIEQSRRVAELNPNLGPVYNWMIEAYQMKGDEQRAFATDLKRAEADGAGPDEIAGMKAAFATGGLKGIFRRRLDRLLKQEKSGYVGQGLVAVLYARLGQKEQALARLQKAVDDREVSVVGLKVDPVWDSYRADPRFVAMVRRIGLAP